MKNLFAALFFFSLTASAAAQDAVLKTFAVGGSLQGLEKLADKKVK